MKFSYLSIVLAGGAFLTSNNLFCTIIDISDLNKADVLQALYMNAKTQGMGRLHYIPGDRLSQSELAKYLSQGYIDYLKGRVMKIDLSGNTIDTRLYDRDNGPDAAERAIAQLRSQQTSAGSSSETASTESEVLTLPSVQVLKQRLAAHGFDHFEEKTQIAEKLGGQKKVPMGVAVAVELALHDYAQNLQNPMIAFMMQMRKPELLEILLQDFPDALTELRAHGLL